MHSIINYSLYFVSGIAIFFLAPCQLEK